MSEKILIKDLSDLNPFLYPIWEGIETPITIEEVLRAVKNKLFLTTSFDSKISWTREQHIARIAYLVVNKSKEPIVIYHHLMRRILIDGNHRLASAIVRKEKYIFYTDY